MITNRTKVYVAIGACVAGFAIFAFLVKYTLLLKSCDEIVSITDSVPQSCGAEFRRRSENGDVRAMGLYAEHLLANDLRAEGYKWLAQAASSGNIHSLFRAMLYCEQGIPGFDKSSVEPWVLSSIVKNRLSEDAGTAVAVRFYSGEYACGRNLDAAGVAIANYEGHDCSVAKVFADAMFGSGRRWAPEERNATQRILARCRTRDELGPVGLLSLPERDELLKKIDKAP